jgi:flagellar hook-length control protein FliK
MLQAVHSETTVAAESPQGGAAPDPFAPFLRLAMDEPALLAPLAAPQARGALASAALASSPRRASASAHWARESLARAQGQGLGVNLAEIAAGELASPGASRAAAEGAPEREAPAREWGDSRADGGRSRGSEELPSRRLEVGAGRDEERGEQRPAAAGADRSGARAQSIPQSQAPAHVSARVAGVAAGSAPGASGEGATVAPGAARGAGQVQGGPGSVSPAAASAWKLDAAGRAGKTGGAGGAGQAQTPSRALQTQMERGLGAVLRQGGGSLTMRLKPAALGEVRIHMTMDQGAVRARFESASGEARELMTAGLGALRAALEARGLRVESLEVAADAHDRGERPAAEPPRGAESPQQEASQRHAPDDRGAGRADEHGGRSAAGRDGMSRDGTPEGGPEHGGNGNHAPEDPADIQVADDASETLVSLRLDTVA